MHRKCHFYAVDLFAGCGGLSEGFKQAGFDIIAQVEMDRWACETLRTRHLYHELKKIGKGHLYCRYLQGEVSRSEILDGYPNIEQSISCRVIKATLGEEGTDTILKKIEASKQFHGASRVHLVLGGPPCQCYSVVGRARDPLRMENDERHYLYRYYLEILEYLQPDFFLYENVPGIFTAKAGGSQIFRKMVDDFSLLDPPYGITPPLEQISEDPCSYIVNSADFHVPQSRKRLILLGYRRSLERTNPEIIDMFASLQIQARRNRARGHLTVDDAIGDLPRLKPGDGSDSWLGPYHPAGDLKHYQISMRRHSPGVLNHRARTHMRGDLDRYRFFIEHHLNGTKTANITDLLAERPDLTPAHSNLDKFLDRFRVQWWNRPASTITAHIHKDGHYYIHPDIDQCRSLTVREAARCQSFPDNYKFEGPRTQQFKKVGNAVPPLLSRVMARVILRQLSKIHE